MAENENVVKTTVGGSKPSKWSRFLAALKERGRKFIVNLKRNPQRIPLFFMVIVSALWLIWLFTFSQTVYRIPGVNWIGVSVFVITLLEILVLALFSSAFPKRKKPNIVFIVLLFVFMALIVFFDVLYYHQVYDFVFTQGKLNAEALAMFPCVESSLSLAIAHIILIGICALLLATLPLYSKLIMKINTKKVVDSNDIKENIDVSED
jgi:hypothetical protein